MLTHGKAKNIVVLTNLENGQRTWCHEVVRKILYMLEIMATVGHNCVLLCI